METVDVGNSMRRISATESYANYHAATQNAAGFDDWLYRQVTGVENRREYVERLGGTRLAGLQVREHAYAPAVDYGF